MNKKYFLVTILVSSLSIIMISSCKHDPIFPGNEKHTVSTKCDPDTVYFINSILPIIQSNCAMSGCHGNGSAADGVELSNYENIISKGGITPGNPNKGDFFEVITETDSRKVMPPPPNSKLSADQINLIRKWIQQGARNNECKSGCDSIQFNYSSQIAPIIQNNCLGCHNSNNIKIGTHAQLKTQVDNGKLWGAINHQQGFLPMPSSSVKLSDCDIKKIQKWIAAGAPNN